MIPSVLEPRRLHGCPSSTLRSRRAVPNQLESEGECSRAPNAETVARSAIEDGNKEEANDNNGGLVKVVAATGGGKVYLVLPCLPASEQVKGSLLWPKYEEDKSLLSAKSLLHLSACNNPDNLTPVEQALEVPQSVASNISNLSSTSKPSQQMSTHRVAKTGDEKVGRREETSTSSQKLGRFRYMKSSRASKLR